MKTSKYTLYSILMLIVVAAAYRAIPGRPWGFAPQFAMTIFAGAVIKNRKFAYAVPLVSMFISDVLYQILYVTGLFDIQGFYSGMWVNYLLFGSLTTFGFWVKADRVSSIAKASLAAPTAFFFISNALTWAGNGGWQHPRTAAGFIQTMIDGIPFYTNSLLSTIVFAALFFGVYQAMMKSALKAKQI